MTDISMQSQTASQTPAPNSPARRIQEWEIVLELRDAMYKAGIEYDRDLHDDGVVYRFYYGDKGENEGWYVFYGLAGAFGDRKRRIYELWSFDKELLSLEDIEKQSQQIEKAKKVYAVTAKLLNPYGLKHLLALEVSQRKMLLNPIIPENSLTLIHAPQGLGKTQVALMIAYAVATGGTMFEGKWSSAEPSKVLIIDGEMPLSVIHAQLGKIMKNNQVPESIDQNLQIITPDLQEGTVVDLSTPYGKSIIEELLTDVKLLILDNYSSLCTGGVNDSKNWIQLQKWFLGLRDRGTSVLLIDFSKKKGGLRGNYRKEDVFDTIISLRKPTSYDPREGARFEVHYDKARNFQGNDAISFEAWLKNEEGKSFWQVKDIEKAQLDEILTLKDQGFLHREIARKLGVSLSTINRRFREIRKDEGKYEGGAILKKMIEDLEKCQEGNRKIHKVGDT